MDGEGGMVVGLERGHQFVARELLMDLRLYLTDYLCMTLSLSDVSKFLRNCNG